MKGVLLFFFFFSFPLSLSASLLLTTAFTQHSPQNNVTAYI